MGKDRLTKRQQQRIEKKQQQKRLRAQTTTDYQKNDNEQVGLLVTHFGQHLEVKDQDGTVHRCVARKHLGSLAVGDHVIWCAEQHGDGVIVAVEPRQSELYRYHKHEGNKLFAANVDQLFIVVAIEPPRAMNIIDRYIMLAELQQITPVIVFNKTDLLSPDDLSEFTILLNYYQRLGYSVLYTSAQQQDGITKLLQSLVSHRSIVVGLSGVGKSSLIKTLLPTESITIGELSEVSREGNHTTTNTRLYQLPQGGELIDCPGIRELAMGKLDAQQVILGFKELAELANRCQFRDCNHQQEPGCAIIAALNNDQCNPDRFASYQNIIAEINGYS